MLTGLIVGFIAGVLGVRLWKPLLSFYLRKENEIKKELQGE